MSQIWRMLIFVLCFQVPAWAWETETSAPWFDAALDGINLPPQSFDRITGVLRDSERPVKQSLALSLAPKLLELQANYWDRRRAATASGGAEQSGSILQGSYVDMLARSSPWEGKLVGESEVAYSALALSPAGPETPLMTRFGLGGNWDKAGYGFTYRSFGRGFVPLAGARVEHERDESQLWGEYNFDLFRLRGSAGEICETDSVSRQLTLTRTATASFQVNQPAWSLFLSSNYAATERSQPAGGRSFTLANRLAFVYRPAPLLTFEPAVQLSREWEPATGVKSDTPSAGFTLAYAPMREVQLLARASIRRSLGEDLRGDASSIDSAAGLSWKLDKSLFGDGSLSLHLEYKNDSGTALSNDHPANLTGMIQFRLAGF